MLPSTPKIFPDEKQTSVPALRAEDLFHRSECPGYGHPHQPPAMTGRSAEGLLGSGIPENATP